MIAHVVLFEPKADVSPEQKRAFLEALRHTIGDMPEIRQARVGRRMNIGYSTNADAGRITYSYVAVLEFDDEDALRRYLDHPAHRDLGHMFWRYCQATAIADAELLDIRSSELSLLVE